MAKILVVDDDPDFAEIIRMVLVAKGYEVATASNAESALTAARDGHPDLILLDVMMSGVLDGVHVARTLRDDPDLGAIPVIMISSIADSSAAELFPAGEYLPIDMWISKPVQPDDLLAQVSRFVGPA